MKILIVDDDIELTKAVETALTSYDHDVLSANDSREGLELIKEKNYDLIFLDLAMPEFSGVDIINYLVKKGTIKEKKIVIFTASAINDTQLKNLIDLGAHSFLRKPVDIDAILDKIEEVGSS